MNTRSLLTGTLLILAVGGIIYVLVGDQDTATQTAADPATTVDQPTGGEGGAVAAGDLPRDGVVVYYFHGRQRCYTCNKMETLAESVIAQQFTEDVRDGWVLFKSVDMQTPEHSHFVQDFELRSASVVMVERRQGQEAGWRRLDEVWTKIRDEEQYRSYIAENLAACLREVGLEKS
jgi:hypothetical protein